MVRRANLESLTVMELRALARSANLLDVGKLSRRDLLRLFRRLSEIDQLSTPEIRQELRSWDLPGIERVSKRHLGLALLHASRWQGETVNQLRSRVQKADLSLAARARKDEMISGLVQSFLEGLEPARKQLDVTGLTNSILEKLRRLPWKTLGGRSIQAAGAVGVGLGLIGLIAFPILFLRMVSTAQDILLSFAKEIQNASLSMQEVGTVLLEGTEALDAAAGSIQNINGSIQDLEPLIDSTSLLLGESAPQILEDTRAALSSAEEGAAAIDGVLRNLARFGLLTGVSYNPAQPLDEGIAKVASSLEPLPVALRSMGSELEASKANLFELRSSLGRVGGELDGFTRDISGKHTLLVSLADDLAGLADRFEQVADNLSGFRWTGVLVGILLSIWFSLGQGGIYFMGEQVAQKQILTAPRA